MSDAITLIDLMNFKGTDEAAKESLDAWPYRELELELRVYQVDGPGSHYVTVLLETAASLSNKDPWRPIGRFTPMNAGGIDRRAFRHLLRYVRWRAITNVSGVSALLSLAGMAR